jgi:hypothetical protein
MESLRRKLPDMRKWWDKNGAMLTGKVEDLNLIDSMCPESLESKDIPSSNEWFRVVDKVLQDGLNRYNEWQSENPKLAQLWFDKPENYLSIESVADRLSEKIIETPDDLKEGYVGYIGYLIGTVDDFDKPYSMIVNGSGANISSLQQMILIDPGTGFVKNLRSSMQEEFGKKFDVWSACLHEKLTDGKQKFMVERFQDWYNGAMEYIRKIRSENKDPISTSIVFSYFLHRNNGDILASTWDTSTWLKILVRNDPENNLERDPNYDRAKMATDLFRDEFSPTLSANWVVKNVSKSDKLLNYIGDPYLYPEYKDYMPSNRAGGYYHAWNIMALSMSMSPFIVKRMVAMVVNPSLGDNGKRWTENGRAKCIADMLVVNRADKIASIVDGYS